MKILVVEDNLVNQKVSILTLKKLGYQAEAVGNGVEALEKLKRSPYDVVFINLEMPEMDGFRVTELMRQLSQNGEYPWIIGLTKYALSTERRKCLASGINGYLSKPIKEQELIEVLQQGEEALSAHRNIQPSKTVKQEGSKVLERDIIDSLRKLAGENAQEFLTSIVGHYQQDGVQTLKNIEQAIAARDAFALRQYAHTLRSCSVSLGASNLGKLCQTLEEMGKTDNITPDTQTQFLKIKTEYKQVVIALQLELEEK